MNRGQDHTLLPKLRELGDFGLDVHVSEAEARGAVARAQIILARVALGLGQPG